MFILFLKGVSFYEITVEGLETAFGEDDQIFSFETLRIKKFNRTSY